LVRRAERTPGEITRQFVAVARHPIGAAAKWFYDLDIAGRENLPDGPYVLAANHLSFIDPVLVTLVAKQNVRYMAVASLFEASHMFDRLISFFGAIPTPRDRVPIAAVRAALDELAAGRPVGVFPEGRRVAEWREEPPQRGAAWLAFAAGVPLVPVAMQGSQGTLGIEQKAFRRTAIRIWVESPFDALDFVDCEDPVGALTEAWLDVVGHRLDPWWESEHRV
jgi:1-acyl-sn-glycerol-3-phosphate acyltransferase